MDTILPPISTETSTTEKPTRTDIYLFVEDRFGTNGVEKLSAKEKKFAKQFQDAYAGRISLDDFAAILRREMDAGRL